MATLSVKNITKSFGGLVAVNDASFEIADRAIHGLIGPNGAGKTTMFSLITGFYKPTSGTVRMDGADVTGLSTSHRARLGLVRTFQGSLLFAGQSVLDNVMNGLMAGERAGALSWLYESRATRAERMAKAQSILDFCGLHVSQDAIAGDLAHGQQRVLGIAVALAAEPKLLLLDEPFTGMTAQEKDTLCTILERVRQNGTTVVLVEHDMRTVMRLCDRITVLNFGSVLTEGTPAEVRRHPEVMAAYLGTTS